MTERSPEWMLGYKAGKDGVVVAQGQSSEWLSGWLVGCRDRDSDALMDEIIAADAIASLIEPEE